MSSAPGHGPRDLLAILACSVLIVGAIVFALQLAHSPPG